MRRSVIPAALAVMVAATACQSSPALPAPPTTTGQPAIPDAQPVVDAPLFLGQSAFAAPLGRQADFSPLLATVRADAGNSGVVNGLAPLGRAPVAGSASVSILAPLLWGRRGGLTSGCQVEVGPGITKACLAAVNTSTLTVAARWLPPGQDLNLASVVVDNAQRVLVTTRQRHLFVVARPDADGAAFRVVRDVDLNGHLADGQGLLAIVADAAGNLWFTTGGPPPAASAGTTPAAPVAGTTDTMVGYVTPDDQVVTTTLHDQRAETGLAVDEANVYLATAPAGAADTAGARGVLFDLTATATATATASPGPAGGTVPTVEIVWRESYDAGSSAKPGGTTRGTGAPVVLLGSQYLAVTDNSDSQTHLLVYLRGSLPAATGSSTSTTPSTSTAASTSTGASSTAASTSTTSSTSTTATPGAASTPAPAPGLDPRLVCTVNLFAPGASAVDTAPIGYSSGDTNSVIVANGYNAPPPLTSPTDGGRANDINQMAPGVTRVDILPDGSGCRTQWTAPLRVKTAPVLSSATGLLYSYTEDEARAAAGNYVWYFVAVDYRTGRVVWRQRAGAGATKNDNRQPTIVGGNGVLYQTVPLGLVWMRDVAQRP